MANCAHFLNKKLWSNPLLDLDKKNYSSGKANCFEAHNMFSSFGIFLFKQSQGNVRLKKVWKQERVPSYFLTQKNSQFYSTQHNFFFKSFCILGTHPREMELVHPTSLRRIIDWFACFGIKGGDCNGLNKKICHKVLCC